MFVLEFNDLATIHADEVIVGWFVEKVGIEGRLSISQVNFLEEPGLREEGKGAVESGPGCLGVRAPQPFPELVGGEVLVAGEDDFHDGVSLGGVPEPFPLDEGVEPLADIGCHARSMTDYSRGESDIFLWVKAVLAVGVEPCCCCHVRWLAIFGTLGLLSCSGPRSALEIRHYHLRALAVENELEVLRGEQWYRFHGAVTAEERRNRLGHYYGIEWRGPEELEQRPVRLVFRYRQAATGSEGQQRVVSAAAGFDGKAELQITGPGYLKGGRVLSWHLSYYRGDQLVETRQSYLWK